ncbi:MAG TPA: glycosyltransferase, partial [Acidimicrobiales bacterium]|nr:glycosyltransferase [Acidimicrobiales bacterium]
RWVRPGDIVLLHDPQTLGLAAHLRRAGVTTIWRSHIGVDHANEWTAQAWEFLRPLAEPCGAYVFSRAQYVPPFLAGAPVTVIAPSIDPFSPKNQDLAPAAVARILRTMGLTAATGADGDADGGTGVFTRADGSPGRVRERAAVVGEGPPLDHEAPLVVQVSRWDHLKDMVGVLAGFAAHVAGRHGAQLALVGPAVHDVSDDPEGAAVLGECVVAWEGLAPSLRRHIRLVTLPMEDTDENAAMVNALQRHAAVVVQKSLAEGFGLTVAEGMWKARPVLASAVGGIVDQVAPDTGVLLPDPTDLDAYGAALEGLLADATGAAALGERARRHVRDNFLGDRHLLQYAELLERVLAPGPG